MSSGLAAIAYACMILGMFWLNRDEKAKTSVALWLPVVWVFLACSRSVAQWLLWDQPIPSGQTVQEGSPIDRNVYMGAVVVGLMVVIARRRRIWKLVQANWPVALFFLYCAVSLVWSDYPDVASKRWIKALGDFVMVLIVLSDREPLAAVKRLLSRVSFLLIPLSVLFIKYYPSVGKGYGEWDYQAHYTGVTTNKNALGAICLFFGLASLWRFTSDYRDREGANRKRHLIAHGAILAMVGWLFWMANSMTSFSCFLMASFLIIATDTRAISRKPALVHFLVFLVILVPFSTLFLGVGADLAQGAISRDVSTLTDRTGIWKLVLSENQNPLLGTGFESFWLGPRLVKIYRQFPWRPNQSHNGYLEVFINLGWIGVALLGVVLVTGYRRVITAYRSRVPTGSLVLAFFTVGVVYNFTEAAFFRMMAPAWIFFLLAIASGAELRRPKILSRSTLTLRQHPYDTTQPLDTLGMKREVV